MNQVTKSCCGAAKEVSELLPQLKEIIEDYRKVDGALIPVLQLAQGLFGYLPEEALKMISAELDIPYSEVTGVTFFTGAKILGRGKHVIRVCLGTACYVRGGKDILDALKKALKIDVGQTTEDRLFTLDVGRCFGACGLAPVVMIDDETFQRVKPAKINELLAPYAEESNG